MIIDPATAMLASEGFAGTPAWVCKPGTTTDYHLWGQRRLGQPPAQFPAALTASAEAHRTR